MSPCKHVRTMWSRDTKMMRMMCVYSLLVCAVCGCTQDKDEAEEEEEEEGVSHWAFELGHNGIKNTDGIIWPEFVERTQAGRREGGVEKGWHSQTEERCKEKEKRRKGRGGRAGSHTKLIRFYRSTRLKGWSRLLSSEMPEGVRPYECGGLLEVSMRYWMPTRAMTIVVLSPHETWSMPDWNWNWLDACKSAREKDVDSAMIYSSAALTYYMTG